MIINGGSRCNGRWFAKHLTNTRENDRAEVVDMRGLAATQIADAFKEMEAVAIGTKCTNYFYHATINPRDDEHLTPAEWALSVDRLEKNMGLEGQARFVVEHEKKGRIHRHVIWSRIDLEHMRAIRMDDDYATHQATARQLENAFDLERGRSVLGQERDGPRPERRPKQWEMFRGQQSGLDPRDIKAELTALWRSVDSGHAFTTALEAQGYILAKGDRRDFCVIDRAGDEHSLARRIQGVKAAEVRERMAAIDRAALPSVAEARALHKARMMAQETERAKPAAAQTAEAQLDATPQPQAPAPDASAAAFLARQAHEKIARDAERLTAQRAQAPQPTLEKTVTDAGKLADRGIMVASTIAGRAASQLLDVVSNFLDFFVGKPAPRKISTAELLQSVDARKEDNAQQRAAQQRDEALDRISEQLKKSQQIEPAALGALSYSDLQHIKDQGDDGLRALVRQREEELQRHYTLGRRRER